MVEFLERFV